MRKSLGSGKEIYGKTFSTPHLKMIQAVADVATYFRNGLCVTNWGCLPRSPGGGSKIRPNSRSLQFQVKRAADPAPSRMHPRRIRRHHFWKRNFNCSFPRWNNGYDQDRRRGRERIVNLHVQKIRDRKTFKTCKLSIWTDAISFQPNELKTISSNAL